MAAAWWAPTATAAAAATGGGGGPASLLVYNLSYADTTLSRADYFEHTLLVAALSGLANRDEARVFTPYMPADSQWRDLLQQGPDGWLANTTFEEVASGGAALLGLVQRVRASWPGGKHAIKGIVLCVPCSGWLCTHTSLLPPKWLF